MKNKKIIAYAMLPVLSLSLLSAGTVFARGMGMMGGWNVNLSADDLANRQQAMFQNEAQILGLSVDDVKDAWAKGETLQQLAQEKGISQDTINANLQAQQLQKMKDQLSALVTKGIITQAQADQRLQVMQTKFNNKTTAKMGRHMFRGLGF